MIEISNWLGFKRQQKVPKLSWLKGMTFSSYIYLDYSDNQIFMGYNVELRGSDAHFAACDQSLTIVVDSHSLSSQVFCYRYITAYLTYLR